MSGIYISGIEMPKNCLDCSFTDDHAATCKLLNLSVYFNVDKRAVDCPLVPVPEHGRLIDADKFLEDCPELTAYEQIMETVIEADIPSDKEGEG